VSFFPQLVAGPIERPQSLLPQFETKKYFTLEMGSDALRQILWGLFKKIVIADNCAIYVNDIFSSYQDQSGSTLVLAVCLFSFQIYCDFSGYSDIAIGAALIMGFKIPMNFNKPYFATSPADFWRRWHISLSTWLRDYLYLPLGGNRKSKERTYINLLIVMLLGGLWHGASLNFILWGALHGMYLVIHRMLNRILPDKLSKFFSTRFGKIISITITQYFVFLAWIAFRVKDTDAMIYSLTKYIILDFLVIDTIEFILLHKLSVGIMILFIILNFISYKKNIKELIINLRLRYWIIALAIPITLILLFYDATPNDFIYFQF